MTREKVGRVLITVIALFWALGACAADFNETHVFNPTWPPHARFHGAFQLVLALATNAIAIRLTWSPNVSFGTLLVGIYPAAFFVVPLVPGVAFADPGQPARELAGVSGQVLMAAVTLSVLALGHRLTRVERRTTAGAHDDV